VEVIDAFISERRWKRQTVRGTLLKGVNNGNKIKKIYISSHSVQGQEDSITLK